MPLLVDLAQPLSSRGAPRQKHNASGPLLSHSIDDLLREPFPPPIGMTIRFVRTNRQTGIQEQNATVGPGSQEPQLIGRWLE